MKDIPFVLLIVDENSRLSVLQHEGVRVAFIDRRVDPSVVLLPESHQPIEMYEATANLPLLSPSHDDEARSAAETIRRIAAGDVVVAGLLSVRRC